MPRTIHTPTKIAADDTTILAASDVVTAPTKAAVVLALLRCPEGASVNEIIAATGWQPHTTRAMLTGLRKKGHAIKRDKRGDVTCYYLPAVDA